MGLRPLHDRVLIKRFEEKEQVRGIIIPDTAREKPMTGQVLEVGNGRMTEEGRLQPLDVKKGDKVIFGKYAGTEVKIGDQEYVIMKEDDIFGIIQE
jgi:chaperonin GroES